MKRYALRLIVRHFARVARLPRIRAVSRELLLDIIDAKAEAEAEDARSGMVQDVSYLSLSDL